MSHRFDDIQAAAGVPRHRLYDARHTAASLLLAQGVAPRVVMEVLGHSTYHLTMDTYSHVPAPRRRRRHGPCPHPGAKLRTKTLRAADSELVL
jgi:integrase